MKNNKKMSIYMCVCVDELLIWMIYSIVFIKGTFWNESAITIIALESIPMMIFFSWFFLCLYKPDFDVNFLPQLAHFNFFFWCLKYSWWIYLHIFLNLSWHFLHWHFWRLINKQGTRILLIRAPYPTLSFQ